jgi:predicted XRE-type DNA-binding protein
MPSAKTANKAGHITTGNVLEELGFSARDIREMEIKHDLWSAIRAEIESRKLTQSQVARALKIHQPDASLLERGQITRFSVTRLIEFAERLHLVVTVTVRPKDRLAVRVPLRSKSRGREPGLRTAPGSRTR